MSGGRTAAGRLRSAVENGSLSESAAGAVLRNETGSES